MSVFACSEPETEQSTDAASPAQSDEDAGIEETEPVEAREAADGTGGGLLYSCTSHPEHMYKMRNTLGDYYGCSESAWYNANNVHAENKTCSYQGKTRRMVIDLESQISNGCQYNIYRSKSGPTSSTCHMWKAHCKFATPPNVCTLTLMTGSTSCQGYW